MYNSNMRICVKCSKEFNPSSRHKKCPACRSDEQKKICVCGKTMRKRSLTCATCYLTENHRLESSDSWKGGRIRNDRGYVLIRVGDKYIFEHILVMEHSIGRKLVKGENVHHKNGIRDDNKIGNLELWCKPQPSGIRAEDAYRHALQTVERYKDLFLV